MARQPVVPEGKEPEPPPLSTAASVATLAFPLFFAYVAQRVITKQRTKQKR